MDDVDNEVLDWENEDDEQQQQGGDPQRQSVGDDDADDVVSLGDDDEQPSHILEEPQAIPNPPSRSPDPSSNRESGGRDAGPPARSPPTFEERSDRHENRRRSRRDSPQRSHAIAPTTTRITHALPPKPVVVAPAVGVRRTTSTKGGVARSLGDDGSPTSASFVEWEARFSSKGAIYYYNRINFESTWEKPAGLVAPPTSDDGRRASQDVEDSQKSLPLSEDDRFYRPSEERARTDDRYSRVRATLSSGPAPQSQSRGRARSPSPSLDGHPPYRGREREQDSRARIGATDGESVEQRGRARPPRYSNVDSYIPSEDSRSRQPIPEPLEHQSFAAPRRRPASPPPLSHNHPIPRGSNTSQSVVDKPFREPRVDRPHESQARIPTGPASSFEYGARTRPYDHISQPTGHSVRGSLNEHRERSQRGELPRPVYSHQGAEERPRHMVQDEDAEATARIPKRPRADRTSSRANNDSEGYEPERVRLRSRSRERGVYEPPRQLPADSRRENYREGFPPPPRNLDAPERPSGYEQNQRSHREGIPFGSQSTDPIANAYASRGVRHAPQEEVVRDNYQTPDAPRLEREARPDVRSNESGREQRRRDPSPKKLGRREARKLASGTNSTPLGKNRFPGNDPVPILPPQRNPPAISVSPVQRPTALPRSDDYGDRKRLADPNPPRRPIYDRPPEPPRHEERPRDDQYDHIPRRPRGASPPPHDFGRRTSDPHFVPLHMLDSGRDTRDGRRSDPERRRNRSPSPRMRVDRPPPIEPRRAPNGVVPTLSNRPQDPTSPDLSRNRSSSTLAGSGASWHSDLGRRVSDPVMAVDGPSERFTPPSERFDTLRLVSAASRDYIPSGPSDRSSTVIHPLPQKPAESTSSRNSNINSRDDRSEHRRSHSRWDAPIPPSSAVAAEIETELRVTVPPPSQQQQPVSPTSSKKALAALTPPRLRRPVPAAVDSGNVTSYGNGSSTSAVGATGRSGREDHEVQRSREKDDDRGVDDDRRRYPGAGGGRRGEAKPLAVPAPAPPMARSNSLLDRLEPASNRDHDRDYYRGGDGGGRGGGVLEPVIPVGRTPSLRDRVSVPSKRDREDMVGGGDGDDVAPERQRRRGNGGGGAGGGGRSRRSGPAKRHP